MSNVESRTENKRSSLFFRITHFWISKNTRNNWVQILIHQPTPLLWYKDKTQPQAAPYMVWSLADVTMTPCDVTCTGPITAKQKPQYSAVVVAFPTYFHLNEIFYFKVFFLNFTYQPQFTFPSPHTFSLNQLPKLLIKGKACHRESTKSGLSSSGRTKSLPSIKAENCILP